MEGDEDTGSDAGIGRLELASIIGFEGEDLVLAFRLEMMPV